MRVKIFTAGFSLVGDSDTAKQGGLLIPPSILEETARALYKLTSAGVNEGGDANGVRSSNPDPTSPPTLSQERICQSKYALTQHALIFQFEQRRFDCFRVGSQ